MRLVLPAFVCSVGNRVVAMDASLLGSRCSFMGSPINPPSGYASALVVAVRTSTDNGCAAAGDAAPLAPGAPVPRPGEWGVISAGALPVGQSQIMGEQRPANDSRHVLVQR